MAKKQGRCMNIGNCVSADTRRTIECSDSEEFLCTECGKELYPLKVSRKFIPWRKLLLLVIPLLAVLVATAVLLLNRKIPEVPKPHPQPVPVFCTDSKDLFADTYLYQYPTLPLTGESKIKAMVEMGAERFDYYIIKRNRRGAWEKVVYSLNNKKSFVIDSGASYEQTFRDLTEYIGTIQEVAKEPLRANDIHFVVSSGAVEDRPRNSRMRYIVEQLRRNYVVNVANTETEAKCVYNAVLRNPAAAINELRKKAFVVDMGASNTKIAWETHDGFITEITYGASYKSLDEYKSGSINDSVVYNSVVAQLEKIPQECRGQCVIIGGTPFQLANAEGKASAARYTKLKSPNAYCPEKMAPTKDDKKKRDKLAGGLNVYKAISDATGCKLFIFDGDSHFGIGYLLTHCGY